MCINMDTVFKAHEVWQSYSKADSVPSAKCPTLICLSYENLIMETLAVK